MAADDTPALVWRPKAIVISLLIAVTGFLLSLVLDAIGAWPDLLWSHFVFGGVCGALAMNRMHPGHPVLILLVFTWVLGVLLAIGAFMFYWRFVREYPWP